MPPSRRVRRYVLAPTIALGVLGAGGAALAAGSSARSTGPDYAYGAENPFADARAAVHVVHTGAGGTHVTLNVWDVDAPAGQRFGAHVHQSPCGASGSAAGGHYQHAGATGSLEAREVWLDVTIDGAGNGRSMATRPWSLDDGAPRSVIVHALPTDGTGAAGARLACIDLDGS